METQNLDQLILLNTLKVAKLLITYCKTFISLSLTLEWGQSLMNDL